VIGDTDRVSGAIAAVLRALSDPVPRGGHLFEIGLFCLEGPLSVSDRVVSASDAAGIEHVIDAEVIEILFFGHMLDVLDPVFSANVLLEGNLGPVGQGWTVRATRS